MASNLNVTELDFDQIKENLKSFMKSQSQFKDYDFEGSNLNVLLDVLSYNTYQNNFYTNMAINEMFLDSAVLPNSVVSHAKELNYLPRSRRSAGALLSLRITASQAGNTFTIPRGTSFLGRCGNVSYNFITNKTYSATREGSSGNIFVANDVAVFERRTPVTVIGILTASKNGVSPILATSIWNSASPVPSNFWFGKAFEVLQFAKPSK